MLVYLDIKSKKTRIAELEKKSAQSDFWKDPLAARDDMRELAELKEFIEDWATLECESSELLDLIDLAVEEAASFLEDEIQDKAKELEVRFNRLELQLLFTGEYDRRDVLVTIHAGSGGVESQDWAEMLLRMYLRWAERGRYQAEVLEVNLGEEAGIKSALIEIKGKRPYGNLKSEHGVHRLVRLSPFDADHARHTSFAEVEVLPEAENQVEVDLVPEDLRIDTFRSSGPGGQHMQKTSSAVRITHIPTGIVVTCQSERSQLQNKENALKVLRARLLEQEVRKRSEERSKLRGEHAPSSWGSQIRSYVLHPYKMVKDHRTDYETSDANAVLDGELEELMKSYLLSEMEKQQ
ncbi:MAG: peptide chain release factor 2 [Chloroflexota bacterium]|nr:peptide chain release factor 2 [Chloroflexota bacterium]